MDWFLCMRSFVDVVELNSFSKAADKRYASSAAMSRRITWLEARLGVQLLTRTTRSLQTTEEGASFYESAKKLLQDFDGIAEFAKTKKKALTGKINIALPLSFTVFAPLNDLLVAFLKMHPEIQLQLSYSNYIQDLVADNIDIAIRVFSTEIKDYGKFKLSTYQIGYYAAPEYLKTHKQISRPEDLLEHNCIVHQQTQFDDWHFKSTTVRANGNLRTNSPSALKQMALRGLGVIRSATVLIKKELDTGKLIPVLEHEWVKPLDVYLFYRNHAGTPYRVLALVELFKEIDLSG